VTGVVLEGVRRRSPVVVIASAGEVRAVVLFNGWGSLGRVVLVAAAVYLVAVTAVRIVGARALAKMSAYDIIVTVALGSLVATVPLTTSISLADGIAVLVTFLGLQELTRYLQSRSRRVHHAVRERPYLVVWDGKLLPDRLSQIDTSADEVRAAVRRSGMMSVADVQAVVLENDGEWSVIPRGNPRDLSALEGLDIPGKGPIPHVSGERPRPDRDTAPHPRPPSAAGPV
jgi:uncharacterized membrane protein YcaP (DUF421 family)